MAKYSWFNRLKNFPSLLIKIHLPIIIFYVAVIVIVSRSGLSANYVIQDPATLTQENFYLGFFSNLGVLLWTSSATICLFTYFCLSPKTQGGVWESFLLFSGFLSAFLAIDDWLLFHEVVFTLYTGLPEELFFIIYAIILPTYLIKFKKLIANKTEFYLLILSIFLFVLSLIIDLILQQFTNLWSRQISQPVEEGLKLLGIVTWLLYFARTSQKIINSRTPIQ